MFTIGIGKVVIFNANRTTLFTFWTKNVYSFFSNVLINTKKALIKKLKKTNIGCPKRV